MSYRFDKKSYMSLRLVQISVTLNDLKGRNGPYFALFHRIWLYPGRIASKWLTMPQLWAIYDYCLLV